MRRLWLAGVTALGLALISAPALAAVLWTLVVTPLTAATGQSTAFALTATNENLLQDIRCIRLNLGPQFSIDGTSITSVSNGGTWTSSATATTATLWTSSGGDRLRFLQSLRFTIRARPVSPGLFAWGATAYEEEDCSRPLGLGVQLDAITVTGATATPSPKPTAQPTPTQTVTPTPIPLVPLPTLPLPTLPLPTVPLPTPPTIAVPSLPLPTLAPVLPTPTALPPIAVLVPSPSPTQRPSPALTAASAPAAPSEPTTGMGGGVDEPPRSGDGAGARAVDGTPADPAVAAPELIVRTTVGEAESPLEIPVLGPLSLGQLWWVPAATIGGPGLLVILIVALQLAGGLAWLPATRRLRGNAPPPAWSVTSSSAK